MKSTTIQEPNLEKRASQFYWCMTDREKQLTRLIAQDLRRYWSERSSNFLVAGVGSVLRLPNGWNARDIDVAVVGAAEDLDEIACYRNDLITRNPMLKPDRVGSGSWTYMGVPITQYIKRPMPRIKTTGINGHLLSKGFYLRPDRSRPIDVQFVTGLEPDEWREVQAKLGRTQKPRGDRSREYFYALLAQYPGGR